MRKKLEVFNTACPRNCYSTCSFRVFTEDGKVVKVESQPLNRATPEGTCLKGLSYVERTNSKNRIIYPLLKKKGVFVQIGMDEALDIIADKLEFFKKEYGPHSILFYAASGTSGLLNGVASSFWKEFGGATTVYGNLCWPAGLEATRIALGEIKHNAPWDIVNADLIVLWGKNPAETNIHQMIPIEKAQSRGAELIVVDPRRTPSSERANLLIQPRQGTDALLALAVAKIIIERDMVNESFVKRYVKGYDSFRKSLNSLSIEAVSEECGISIHFIEKLAKKMGASRAMTLIPGYGMQRFTNGGQTTRCLLALSVITGNIGRPGASWYYADLQGDIFSDKKEPLSYYPASTPGGNFPFRRTIATACLGEHMLKTKAPDLKMAWVERGNPLTQNPDTFRILEAFRKLEFRVVVEQFMTDTAREADIILPAKSMFEQSDIITSYWNPYIQLRQKVVDPPGEVLPESEIYYHLAKKLAFNKERIKTIFPEPSDAGVEAFLKEKLRPFKEMTLETLKKTPSLPPDYQEVAFSDFTFKTPSGKIELESIQAEQMWGVNPIPEYIPLKERPTETYPYALMSPNTKNRIHSQFGNLDLIKELDPEPYAVISAQDAVKKKVADRDRITVYNDRGSLTIVARIDRSIRPGSVVIYNGYWHEEGCPNMLSKGRETDMGHGTAFHDNFVNYKKAEL